MNGYGIAADVTKSPSWERFVSLLSLVTIQVNNRLGRWTHKPLLRGGMIAIRRPFENRAEAALYGPLSVQALANRSARMDQGELARLIAGLFKDRRLQCMKEHAQHGGTGRALRVELVGFAIYMHFQDGVCLHGEWGLFVFRHGDDAHALGFADINDGQQLSRLATARSEQHDVALLHKAHGAVHRLGGRDEAAGAFNAAHQMRKVLAHDAGMTAAGGRDSGSCTQQSNSF